MKSFKRNAVIVTIILFVCVAAYLNWSYGKQTESLDTKDPAADELGAWLDEGISSGGDALENSGLVYTPGTGVKTASSYIAEARLARRQARDSAVETLSTIQNSGAASQEILDSALSKIMDIAGFTQTEAEIETLIKAKGFSDCVVFISDKKITVTVAAPDEGLAASDVAKITDIIVTETNFNVTDLNIVEV